MPNQTKMITIVRAQPSQSGKTLRVQDHDEIWYSCKDFGLQNHIGQAGMIEWSQQNFPDGGAVKWLNSFTPQGAAPQTPIPPQPAPTAPQTPSQSAPQIQDPVQPTSAQPPSVDRYASIVAQTLCKAVTFSDITQAWLAYIDLYNRYLAWRDAGGADVPAAENQELQRQPEPSPAVQDVDPGHPAFDDNIPF